MIELWIRFITIKEALLQISKESIILWNISSFDYEKQIYL